MVSCMTLFGFYWGTVFESNSVTILASWSFSSLVFSFLKFSNCCKSKVYLFSLTFTYYCKLVTIAFNSFSEAASFTSLSLSKWLIYASLSFCMI